METLAELLGDGGWLLALAGLAIAWAGAGWRRRARCTRRTLHSLVARARPPRALGDGPATARGRWLPLDGARGLLVGDDGDALVVLLPAPRALAAGTALLVDGVIDGQADDPRGGGYRGAARLPRLAVIGVDDVRLADDVARARPALWAAAGGALFAGGLTLAAAATLVALRLAFAG